MSAMDITEEEEQQQQVIVSDITSSSGLSVSVHPLVLLNISDQYTRTKLQHPSVIENGKLYGVLLATQSGRDIDIINSFELLPITQDQPVQLDTAFLLNKLEQLKQVFPQLDFMGWYSIGSTPTETDLRLHEQFLQINESALFLQLNPNSIVNKTVNDFPVSIYESIYDIANEQTRLVFIKAAYRVETGEAECIAVDHVAKPSTSSADTGLGNTLIAHLTTQRNAIAMLHARIQFLLRYLQDAESGKIPMDHDILRQISSLCRRSPILEKGAFEHQFSTEYEDVLLVAYLATITKGLNTVNDLVDKFNLVNGGHGPTSNKTVSKKGRRVHGRY